MKKTLTTWIFSLLIVFVFTMWFGAYFLSNKTKSGTTTEYVFYGEKINEVERLNAVYVALGAFFTALAFAGALWAIDEQRKTALRATSIEIFTKTYQTIMTDTKINKTLEYILKRSKEQKTVESLKKGTVYLNKKPENLYRCLFYFCDKMEYVGILMKQKYLDRSLLYPNGEKIVTAFDTLESWNFFDRNNKERFIHFRNLAYTIKEQKKDYDKYRSNIDTYCKNIEKKIKRRERKNKAQSPNNNDNDVRLQNTEHQTSILS